MTPSAEELHKTHVRQAFRMPTVQTPASRKSSVTNAFVNAVIPVLIPSVEQVAEALQILHIDPTDVRCAYCGDNSTEWDHLRPLVLQRRPTGYVSEIANLVPACGKCNQSKGNKPWREWMLGTKGKWSPTKRGIHDVDVRIQRLEAYERWRKPTRIDFATIIGSEEWEHYWSLCESVVAEMRECQQVANDIRDRVRESIEHE